MATVRDAPAEAHQREQKSVPHLFCAYTKQELVQTLAKAGRPAAAVLLQVGLLCAAGLAPQRGRLREVAHLQSR